MKRNTKSAKLNRKPLHQYDYDPKEFTGYKPNNMMDLDEKGVAALASHIRRVCDLDDHNAFILLLRFGFGVDCDVIRELMKTNKRIHGICEAFRFGCQRYLGLPDAVSDKSLMAAFQLATQDYEILFLHNRRGICWMRQTTIPLDVDVTTLRQALVYAQCRSFIQLEDLPLEHKAFTVLNTWQTKKLAKYIAALPMEFGSILLLHYHCKLDAREIELQTGTRYARGKIEYFRRLFSQRMELEHSISNRSFTAACQILVQEMELV